MSEQPSALASARLALFERYREQGKSEWVQASGWSMSPLVDPGVWLLVEFGAGDARPGSVVLFSLGGEVVSHRVLWRRRSGVLLTKGDATTWLDAPVAPGQLLGVVRALRESPEAAPVSSTCSGPRAGAVVLVSAASALVAACARPLPRGPRQRLQALAGRAAGSALSRMFAARPPA